MAYRRRQQVGRTDARYSNYDSAPPPDAFTSSSSSAASSLAAKAIRASAEYRDSSLSFAYEPSAVSSPRKSSHLYAKEPTPFEDIPKKNINESKQGFWGSLAQKAKTILDDDHGAPPHEISERRKVQTSERAKMDQYHNTHHSSESHQRTKRSSLHKGLGAIASSLNHIGNSIGNALEEGIVAMENRTSEIIQETRKVQLRKKSGSSISQNQTSNIGSFRQQPVMQSCMQPQSRMHTDLEMQLKASRDVAMAMATKAKLLLRELKTVKAHLAFAKERCGQLEEENRILRESHEKGDNLEDDDLVRLQLETLLAEKARLAQENFVYAQENRFLREIVEYHQLTMQDVVYVNEGSEEVTEVYPVSITSTSNAQSIVSTPYTPPIPTIPEGASAIPQATQNVSLGSVPSLELKETSQIVNPVNPYTQMPAEELRRQ